MNRLIINNNTNDLSDEDSIILINNVILKGRISNNNEQYCYGSILNYKDHYYFIYAIKNKISDRFTIINYEGR